jgi:hypothetical protein
MPTPNKQDTRLRVLFKILEALNNVNGGPVSASFFPEGTELNLQDTEWKVLQKMLVATNAVSVTVAALSNVGSDGSNIVFKNSQSYLRDQNGLYHLATGYIVEGQMQGGFEDAGYTYDNIP